MKRRSKVSDPLIVPRVKNYLAENVDKTFVDVGEMARSLRERYREYGSRSEGAFCQAVEAAYKVVLQSYGLDEASSNEDKSDEDSDDLELLDDSNALNDQLMTMYKGKGTPKKAHDKTSELIDISSDEDSSSPKGAKVARLEEEVSVEVAAPETPVVQHKSNKQATNTNDISSTVSDNKKKRSSPAEGARPAHQRKKAREPEAVATGEHKITLDDVGGLERVAEQIYDLALQVRHPEIYEKLGAGSARGALLHGPPGTGKTLLAQAIAGSLGLPLIALPATELVGGFSGESEKNIRELFEKALALAPCALFIDEIDAISGNRLAAQKDMEKRVVAQLLCSLDALDGSQVLVLAATSSPEALDPALRRSGRFELEFPLGIPTRSARKDILGILVRSLAIHPSVDLEEVARLTPGYVGADLKSLINKACATAVRRVFIETQKLSQTENDSNVTKADDSSHSSKENGLVEKKPVEAEPAVVEIVNKEQNGEVHEISNESSAEDTKEEPIVVAEEVEGEQGGESNKEEIPTPQIQECRSLSTHGAASGKGQLDIKELHKFLDEIEPFTGEQLANMNITTEDIGEALKTTKPSAIREGFATVPDVTWDDVGSLGEVRRELQLAVLAPVKYPDQLESLGLGVPSGVLLCGPPGCGKTLLAKAIANEAGINFISVKGPELLNMYVGESERAVRTCFQRARNSAPCVIFFDEFDSLCPRRGGGDHSGASRVVNQLLTEMDGVEGRQGVFVLAASNRPDIIDPAVLRPGRLERVLFVGLPKREERVHVLRALTRRGPALAQGVGLEGVAHAAEGFTGADLAGLVRAAATEALLDFITGGAQPTQGPLQVSASHFQKALLRVRPSVSPKEQQHYDKLRIKYAAPGEPDIEMDTAEESMDTV